MHAISLDHGNRILRVEVRAEAEGEPFSPRLASMPIAALTGRELFARLAEHFKVLVSELETGSGYVLGLRACEE
jgi:hypothetical protein